MANTKYNSAGRAIAINDLNSTSFKVMFCDPTYTPNPDTEVYLSDVVANRADGTTDLEVTLTINVDNTDNRTEFDFTNAVTGTITATTNAVVLYIDTGVESTSELLTYNQLVDGAGTPTTFTVVAGVLTATVDADGIFSI